VAHLWPPRQQHGRSSPAGCRRPAWPHAPGRPAQARLL